MTLEPFDKESFRKSVCDLRSKINEEVKRKMDFNIFNTLISSNEYKNCNTVFVYVSKPMEVSTYEIIEHTFKEGKIVAVPKCNTGDLTMSFYKIKSFDDLKKGYSQIYEPVDKKCEKVDSFSNGLCIVPGLCFDVHGYRIGYGKGYYDRFLKNFRGTKIGICYSDFIFKELPADAHDEKVDILITDKNILKVVV